MKLVRFECGCVGFPEPLEDGTYVIIDNCDKDPWSTALDVCFFSREIRLVRPMVELSKDERDEYLYKIQKALTMAEGYLQLKGVLKPMLKD